MNGMEQNMCRSNYFLQENLPINPKNSKKRNLMLRFSAREEHIDQYRFFVVDISWVETTIRSAT